jgi:hypothetical protein
MIVDLATFTIIHTAISLLALLAGIPVVAALFRGRVSAAWTAIFLVLAIITTVTGFLFPIHGLTPALITGVLASLVLAVVLLARGRLASNGARRVYAAGIVASLYFLVFVTIAQAFNKIAPLHALAPNGSEPPFAIVQVLVLMLFLVIGIAAARRFRYGTSSFR